MLKLRPYQQQAVEYARSRLTDHKTCSLVASCGSGKTIVASDIAWKLLTKNRKALIIVPYQSLLDQFTDTLLEQGFRGTRKMYESYLSRKSNPEVKETYDRLCGHKAYFNTPEIAFYAGGKEEKGLPSASVVIAMAQTIESRGVPDKEFKIIFFDESHLTYFRRELHAQLSKYQHYRQAKEILLTATPWRGDGAEYPDGVEHYQVVTTYDLIQSGFNSPYRYFPMGTMEKKIAFRYRDFTEAEETALLEKIANPEKAWEMLSEPNQHVAESSDLVSVFDQRTIFFFGRKAIARRYMEKFGEELQKLGIERELILICDSTPASDRSEAYAKFRRKEALLFTVTCLAIGFDEPSVENIVLLRTFSKSGFALFIQILGRGLRISPTTGKTECRIYDLCANPYFPLPDEVKDWTIPKDPETRSLAQVPLPPEGKECRECGTICGKGMKFCYKCGCDLPAAKSKPPEEELSDLDLQLQAYLADTDENSVKPADEMRSDLQKFLGVKDTRKFVERLSVAGKTPDVVYRVFIKMAVLLFEYKPGWAYFQFKKLFPNEDVQFLWKRHAVFGDRPTFGNFLYYHQYLRNCYGSGDAESNRRVYGMLRDEFGAFYGEFNAKYQQAVKEYQEAEAVA